MNLRSIIIEDNKVSMRVMEHYIAKIKWLQLVGSYPSAEIASRELNINDIDLIFLDIEMPGMSGIEFLNNLRIIPPVIVISHKKKYAADAFNYDAILDYLHKPFSYDRFLKALKKVQNYLEQKRSPDGKKEHSLFVREDARWIRILASDVIYVKADNNYVIIKTSEKAYKTRTKLKDIYSQLPKYDFMQIHRSFIVQLSKIDKVDGEVIEMIHDRTLPVSKNYIGELRKRLNLKKQFS